MVEKKPFFSLGTAKATLTICYGLVIMLIIGPSFLEKAVGQSAPNSAVWLYWLEVASGNWTAAHGIVSDWLLAFSAIISVLLNNAVIIIAVTFVWRFFTERREQMVRLKQALVMRDAMSKVALFNRLDLQNDPETAEKINAAFREVDEKWIEYMEALLSPEDVASVQRKLNEPI